MKTQKDLIQYYSKQLIKIIDSHGADSEQTTRAFFVLQAAKIGFSQTEMFKWAEAEHKRLHDLTLAELPSMLD